jgi:hypothetical protein
MLCLNCYLRTIEKDQHLDIVDKKDIPVFHALRQLVIFALLFILLFLLRTPCQIARRGDDGRHLTFPTRPLSLTVGTDGLVDDTAVCAFTSF